MSSQRLIPKFVGKPWGVEALPAWLLRVSTGERIGEVHFRKGWPDGREAKLLVKYLFTSEALSVQVHPDEAHVVPEKGERAKSEAWFALHQLGDASVALGLRRAASLSEIEAAARDGSIEKLLDWRKVEKGNVFYVPAGTIHAIGADCALIEIQQNSDTTFRLFDYGRPRELHLAKGLASADLSPSPPLPPASRIDDFRQLLVQSAHFAVERWSLPSRSEFVLGEAGEVWLIVLSGELEMEGARFLAGDVAFHHGDAAGALVGEEGAVVLVAYPGVEQARSLLTGVKQSTHRLWDEGHNPGVDPGQSEAG